ncbi:uroporphyrinogen decarboxylase [bacterium]|nr:uroporphyrinogen decarboxylase [bacterium]
METPNTPLYIRAALGEQTERPPIWVMRQAGRYLPEYREVRKQHSFLDMLNHPEVATEVTLQPIRRYGMDAAILFCDILVTAQVLGSKLDFVEKKGPVIANPIRSAADVANCQAAPVNEFLPYVFDAIKLIQKELRPKGVPLIGFAGAPFTVASYMIEGGSSKDLARSKGLIKESPEVMDALLDKLVAVTIDYLNAQIEAGVDALQLFDTWTNHLDLESFKRYSLDPIKRIIAGLNRPANVPITVFCKNMGVFAPLLVDCGANALSVDWGVSLRGVRDQIGSSIALQGNLDPQMLYTEDKVLEKAVISLLDSMKDQPGYIFNLGHGMSPDMEPEKLKLVVDLVHGYKR